MGALQKLTSLFHPQLSFWNEDFKIGLRSVIYWFLSTYPCQWVSGSVIDSFRSEIAIASLSFASLFSFELLLACYPMFRMPLMGQQAILCSVDCVTMYTSSPVCPGCPVCPVCPVSPVLCVPPVHCVLCVPSVHCVLSQPVIADRHQCSPSQQSPSLSNQY